MTDLAARIDLTNEEREFIWTAMESWDGYGGRWFYDDELRMSVQRKMFGRQRFDEEADDFVDMFWNPREESHHREGTS